MKWWQITLAVWPFVAVALAPFIGRLLKQG